MRPSAHLIPLLLTAIAVGQAPPVPPPAQLQEHARNLLDDALQDKNPDTRKLAAQSLSLAGPREPFMSKLEAMLDDKDVEVRLAAVASLAELKTSRTKKALEKALNDDAPEVGFAAAQALYGLKDPEGKRELLSVLEGETKTASGFITKQKRDALRMMHTPRKLMWFAVRQGAGMAPVPGLGEGIASMQGILSDPGTSGRAMAALLLGRERDSATLAALREALEDKDASVRAAAVHSLALRNDVRLVKEIAPLMDDKKETVRLRAAAGYLRLEMLHGRSTTSRTD